MLFRSFIRSLICEKDYLKIENIKEYINKNNPQNTELIKAITYVNIASLNYPDEIRLSLENLKQQFILSVQKPLESLYQQTETFSYQIQSYRPFQTLPR